MICEIESCEIKLEKDKLNKLTADEAIAYYLDHYNISVNFSSPYEAITALLRLERDIEHYYTAKETREKIARKILDMHKKNAAVHNYYLHLYNELFEDDQLN